MSEPYPFYSEEDDAMSKREQLEGYFSQSLEVDTLLRLCPDDEDTIYQIVDLLVDTCATNRKTLRIAGDDKPAEVVRSRFMKLNPDRSNNGNRCSRFPSESCFLSRIIPLRFWMMSPCSARWKAWSSTVCCLR